MKTIYVFGLLISDDLDLNKDVVGYAASEVDFNDMIIYTTAQHLSSNESLCKYDMGITSDAKHDIYNSLYPDGYRLEWIGCFDSMRSAYKNVSKRIKKSEREIKNSFIKS